MFNESLKFLNHVQGLPLVLICMYIHVHVHVHTYCSILFVYDIYGSYCHFLHVSVHVSMQGATSGILRGSGRQILGAILNFFCYYVIGLPVGISLAFAAGMGTLGIWTGLALADGLQVHWYMHTIVKAGCHPEAVAQVVEH